jgi:hypothetical protein
VITIYQHRENYITGDGTETNELTLNVVQGIQRERKLQTEFQPHFFLQLQSMYWTKNKFHCSVDKAASVWTDNLTAREERSYRGQSDTSQRQWQWVECHRHQAKRNSFMALSCIQLTKCNTLSCRSHAQRRGIIRFCLMHGKPGSSVSIVSGYGLDDRAIEVRSPAQAKGFFL